MATWIDFKAVKDAARFEPVLERYGLELTKKGSELTGLCPFHEDSKPSFSVNTEKRLFHCFACKAKGNILDFVAKKEGVSVRRAAELVCEWLGLEADLREHEPKSRPPQQERAAKPQQHASPARSSTKEPEGSPCSAQVEADANRPLSFVLQLEHDHPYLLGRGVDPELAQEFGVGFCSRGMMKGRIAIPLHNEKAQLVGYLGRWAHDVLPEGEERFKLPPGFRKNELVFNLHRVAGAGGTLMPALLDHLVVVEGCFSVFRLHSLNVRAVALLGSSISETQEELLVRSGARRLTLLLDGDSAGEAASRELLPRLARRFFVRLGKLPEGTQPDTVDHQVLEKLVKE